MKSEKVALAVISMSHVITIPLYSLSLQLQVYLVFTFYNLMVFIWQCPLQYLFIEIIS